MKQNTIERCLEILSGFDQVHEVKLEQLKSSDVNLMQSLGRQVVRSIPLTDRQYDLAVVKCNDYYNILNKFGIDKTAFENLRMPLREIDRSKWVRKVEYTGEDCLAIRFTFNKKLIELLEKTRTKESNYNEKSTDFSAASIVFSTSIAIVIGPTPPGTGEIAPAFPINDF